MRGAAAHDLYKVPVLLGRVGITLDVADDLAVGLGGGIEAEGALDVLVLQVAVDGLGAADDLHAGIVGGKVLSQHSGVGVGIVAADDHNSGNAVLPADPGHDLELLFGFQLGSAGADDVKAAGVTVAVNIFVIKDNVVILKKSAGTALEAVENVVLIGGLQCIV